MTIAIERAPIRWRHAVVRLGPFAGSILRPGMWPSERAFFKGSRARLTRFLKCRGV